MIRTCTYVSLEIIHDVKHSQRMYLVGVLLACVAAGFSPARALDTDDARWDRWTRSVARTARGVAEGRVRTLPVLFAVGRSVADSSLVVPEERGVRVGRSWWSEATGGVEMRIAQRIESTVEVGASFREARAPAGRLVTLDIRRSGDRHAFAVGKTPLAWGGGVLGSLLLGASAPSRPQVYWTTERALGLPGPVRPLGTWSGSAFLAYLDDDQRLVANPMMFGHRLSWQFVSWAQITMTRTVMFGGDGRIDRLSPRGVWLILIGKDSVHGRVRPLDSNQKLSWELRIRGVTVPALGIEGLEAFYEYAGDDMLRFPIPSLVARHAGIAARMRGWTGRIEGATTQSPTGAWYGHQAVFGPNSYSYRGFPLGLPIGSQARTLWVGLWTPEAPFQLRGNLATEEFGAAGASPEMRTVGVVAARWRPAGHRLALEVEYAGGFRRGVTRHAWAPALVENQCVLRLTAHPAAASR